MRKKQKQKICEGQNSNSNSAAIWKK